MLKIYPGWPLRTIEKSKETIVKRPNKVMGLATKLLASSSLQSDHLSYLEWYYFSV